MLGAHEQPRSKLRGIEHPSLNSFRGKPRGIEPEEIKKTVGIFVFLGVFFAPIVAFAIIPLLVGATYYFAADSLFVNALIFSAMAVGSTLAWVGFGASPGAPLASAPIRVQLSSVSPQPAPSGWTMASAGEAALGRTLPHPPPETPATSKWEYRGGGPAIADALMPIGGWVASDLAAAAVCNIVQPGSSPVFIDQFVDGGYYASISRRYDCTLGAITTTIKIGVAPKCEAGYSVLSTTVCNVTPDNDIGVPRPLDGKCTIVAFAKDALDPDCVLATNVRADGASRVDIDDSGGAFAGGRVFGTNEGLAIVTETRGSSGSITYEYVNTADAAGNGNQTITSTGAGDGRGPGYGGGTGGTGTCGGTGQPACASTCGGAGQPACASTCGGAGQPACATSGVAVCGASPLPPCTIDLGGQSPAPGDPTATTSAELNTALELPLLQSFKTFSLPGHVSECPRPSFTWRSTSYVIDAHCALLDAHTALLRAAMSLVFSIGALFTVLRA